MLDHEPEEKTKDDNQKICPEGGDQKANTSRLVVGFRGVMAVGGELS